MKKIKLTAAIVWASVLIVTTPAYSLPTEILFLGDRTVEEVQTGYGGDVTIANLEYWFDKNGITNVDGTAVNPITDQLQHELFYTDVSREYEIEFIGIGCAGYHSPFGVFTYDGDPFETFDASLMTFEDPLFIQNEVYTNTFYNFTIESGAYFGFYLNSNGVGTLDEAGKILNGEDNFLTTIVASNALPTSDLVRRSSQYNSGLDHTLLFETNRGGYTIAFEDIVGGGDADYEDLVVNFRATGGSGFNRAPIPNPEPRTFVLFGLGLLGFGCVYIRKKNLRLKDKITSHRNYL